MRNSGVKGAVRDEELTAAARAVDASAEVLIEHGCWLLVDTLGRFELGRDRIAATRDLAHYLAMLQEELENGELRPCQRCRTATRATRVVEAGRIPWCPRCSRYVHT